MLTSRTKIARNKACKQLVALAANNVDIADLSRELMSQFCFGSDDAVEKVCVAIETEYQKFESN